MTEEFVQLEEAVKNIEQKKGVPAVICSKKIKYERDCPDNVNCSGPYCCITHCKDHCSCDYMDGCEID